MPVKRLQTQLPTILLGLICAMPGCVSVAQLQDTHFSCCNRYRASEALKSNFTSDQRANLSKDFQHGFKQGYYDTAMNKDCRLPPVAPPKYWSAKYQSCSGQAAVQDWFRGYQNGIAAAQSSNCPQFAEVPVSPNAPIVNRTGCGACQSTDPCRCQEGSCQNSGCQLEHFDSEAELIDQSNSIGPSDSIQSDYYGDDVMLDKPNSISIRPVSFGQPIGIIGGYGDRSGN